MQPHGGAQGQSTDIQILAKEILGLRRHADVDVADAELAAAQALQRIELIDPRINAVLAVDPSSTRSGGSILADKRPELMLEALSVLGGTLVATESPNERSLQAGDLAARAEPYFSHVESIADPHAARSRALEILARAAE